MSWLVPISTIFLVSVKRVIANQWCLLQSMKKSIGSNLYFVVIVALLSGFMGWMLGWLQVRVEIDSSEPDTSFPAKTNLPDSPQVEQVDKEYPVKEPLPSPLPNQSSVVLKEKRESVALKQSASHRGSLRVSNQTEYPIRLALLARQPSAKSYGKPAHWDFAPGEGGGNGLVMALPEGKLLLEKGDVLTAFAQDGSRLYWGPYIAGETSSPVWDSQLGEWHLVLQLNP